MKPTPPRQPNQSLIDGLRCLQAVALKGENVKAADIGRELDMEPTRVHRLLKTLAYLGFTQQNETRRYSAGPGIMVLAAQTLHASSFMKEALGPLEQLRKELGMIVAMGAVWNRDVSYLYHGTSGVSLEDALGFRGSWPAANSGLGWAVLSGLEDKEIRELYTDEDLAEYSMGVDDLCEGLKQTRSQGYADVKVSSKWGHTTLGVRLAFNPFVAIGVSGTITDSDKPHLVKQLQDTAKLIEDRHIGI